MTAVMLEINGEKDIESPRDPKEPEPEINGEEKKAAEIKPKIQLPGS